MDFDIRSAYIDHGFFESQITLVGAFQKSFTKGIQAWKKETAAQQKAAEEAAALENTNGGGSTDYGSDGRGGGAAGPPAKKPEQIKLRYLSLI